MMEKMNPVVTALPDDATHPAAEEFETPVE